MEWPGRSLHFSTLDNFLGAFENKIYPTQLETIEVLRQRILADNT